MGRNCVRFLKNDPVLVSGKFSGDIEVFRYLGYEDNFIDYEGERKKLHKVLNIVEKEKFGSYVD